MRDGPVMKCMTHDTFPSRISRLQHLGTSRPSRSIHPFVLVCLFDTRRRTRKRLMGEKGDERVTSLSDLLLGSSVQFLASVNRKVEIYLLNSKFYNRIFAYPVLLKNSGCCTLLLEYFRNKERLFSYYSNDARLTHNRASANVMFWIGWLSVR